ncbi:MAG TPA: hypothetical protein VKE40_23970 [Gemmataceae bacterium]|nr:hypothetical protein [Gemmataceae bacterium]
MMRICLAFTIGSVVLAAGSAAADKKPVKPNLSINAIMLEIHRPKPTALVFMVENGKASDEEKKKLVGYYEALSRLKPPKGDLGEWTKKTTELVEAANAVIKGEDKAVERLTKARDCRGCHDKHR